MLAPDRRLFLSKTIKFGTFSLVSAALPLLSAESPAPQTDLLTRMQWMNKPPSSQIEGGKLMVHSTAKADCYRMPGWVIDNGNFFHLAVEGEFAFEARISGQYAAKYDQAGLMVRQDAENWLKCGTEFVDGQRYASVVFTRGLSDWSTMKDLSDTAPVWWRVVRKKDSIETLCSLDGKDFISVRQAYGYFASAPKVEVGIFCASTEGQGVKATFDSLKLSAH